jgi:hypothetical protein
MSNQPPKPSTVPAPARPGSKDARAGSAHEHDDDVLHVPKGVSRGTFIFLVALIIFLMVIWLVPNAMFGIAGGPQNQNPVVVRFELPSGEEVEWKYTDLVAQQRGLQDALSADFLVGYSLGGGKLEKDDLTRLLVLDRIAVDSGVEVTDADLAAHLTQMLEMTRTSAADFKARIAQQGLHQVSIENGIRRLLRVARFQQLVGYAGAVATPAKIEEQWHRDNVEYAFDYVVLAADVLKEEARAALPDDAALQAWFDKLDEGEKQPFMSGEERKAELALFRSVETTPAAELLAAYPEVPPEGAEPTAPDELALQYYNRVYATRFTRQADDEAAPDTPPGFLGFDEVKDVCLAEAPVYFALERWIEDLNARHTNGEPIDLAAETERLGLEHQPYPEALSKEEWGAAGLGTGVAGAVFGASADGSFHPVPVALTQGIAVVRVNERTEPALPAFETIRERVAEKWIEPEAGKLAVARLKALREGLERFEPAPEELEEAPPPKKEVHYRATSDAFRAAVEAAGLVVATRDYLNKASRETPEGEDERALFQQANAFGLYALHADEVAAPALARDGQKAYLVRLAGQREVPIEQMSPVQYDSYKRSVRDRAANEIAQQLDLDFLRASFGLWLYEDDQPAEEAAQAKG